MLNLINDTTVVNVKLVVIQNSAGRNEMILYRNKTDAGDTGGRYIFKAE